jgi:hypothetical protein
MLLGLTIVAFAGCGGGTGDTAGPGGRVRDKEDEVRTQTIEFERKKYHRPKPAIPVLQDDRLEDKVTNFDPELVHSEPLGGWLINLSEAVTQLDVPMIKPDFEYHLLVLHPSYADAIAAQNRRFPQGSSILPSVNMIDGKARQFDDGLYAALEQAYYEGWDEVFVSHVDVVRRIHEKAGPSSVAAPFLAAGLELAGVSAAATDSARKEELLDEFRGDRTASKPIGFYTWNDKLKECFQFLRFFQHEFSVGDSEVVLAMAQVLEDDRELLEDVRNVNRFFGRLTNPMQCLSVADLVGMGSLDGAAWADLAKGKGIPHATVALFPPSTSREERLFERLFPPNVFPGLPEDVNLMVTLITRIRSGEVDLTPDPNSGWYDYQVYALETMLLPEKGEETNKLLLTKAYKKRMLEAFKATITKHRETHVRQLGRAGGSGAEEPPPRPDRVAPRLRVEPCPSYYLRTARAYAFLAGFLESAIGAEPLRQRHGLRKDGQRDVDLATELDFMRDLFYGLYLISAEDIGMHPKFLDDEPVPRERCYQTASGWLKQAFDDPDLAVDTRVSIPLHVNVARVTTRFWTTLGVRLTKLDASFARAPRIMPAGDREWQNVAADELDTSHYLIPVDEFAEVEMAGFAALTRDELREICDKHKTKEAIVKALQKRM